MTATSWLENQTGRRTYKWARLFLCPVVLVLLSQYLPAAEEPGGQRLLYRSSIEIQGPADLATAIRQTSLLITMQDQGAVSRSALNRRIRSDIDAFEKLLRSEGYYGSIISRRTIPGRSEFQITIYVTPGERFVLSAPDISLATEDQELADKLQRTSKLKAGLPARAEDIVITGRKTVQGLALLGYPFARTTGREVLVDHETKQVNVVFFLDQGPFLRFGPIHYEGLATVEHKYLQEFVTWQEGDAYSQAQVDAFRRRLIGTGLFNTASVQPQRPPAGETSATLVVTLSERPHRTISVGGGYSTSEGIGAEFNWEHRNFFGQQERVRAQFVASEIEQNISGLFAKPHFDRLDQTLNFNAKFGREDTDAFERVAIEGGIGVERKLTPELYASIGTQLELFSIKENIRHEEFIVIGLPLHVAWDKTDDPLNPGRGFRLLSTLTPSFAFLEENVSYLTLENRLTTYISVADEDKMILALRARLGSTMGATTRELPASERFFSGGGGSVRGFGYQEIGPKDFRGDPLGGISVAEFGLELRSRLSDTIGLVPFIEGGNVYDSNVPKFSNFRWGAGIGLRYYTSVAPIRLDLAVPLDRKPGESSFQLYISFGHSF